MSQINTSPGSAPPPLGRAAGSNQRTNIPLILIAVGLGLVTVIAYQWQISKINEQISLNTITVYRLSRSVEPGDKLDPKRDLLPIKVPVQFREVYVDGMKAVTEGELSGVQREFQRSAGTNALLSWELFSPPGVESGGAINLRDDRIAMQLRVTTDNAPPFLQPGNMVDIYAMLTPPGRKSQTYLIMERVKVIAVGARTEAVPTGGRSRSYSTITVEVTPEEFRALSTLKRYAEKNEFELAYRDLDNMKIEIDTETVNPEVLRLFGLPAITDAN